MSDLYHRAKEVLLEALAQPAAEREAFLAVVCGGDRVLHQEVESLLAVHDAADSADSGWEASPSETPAFTPGDVFAGRYRMATRLGQGGMGEVWRADDLVLDAPVAIKLIRAASPQAYERVLNEVRLARRITHPAVCRVFDVGELNGQAFYSMELVTGEDLAALIRRGGRLSSEKVIDVAHQLCAGLAAAHGQHVLHRDLKPANVLIDNDGRVCITDFGIAIAGAEAGRSAPVGTPAYMAPEQFDPRAELSERTDIYALGAVLYELITGDCRVDSSGTVNEAPPSKLVSGVDRQLERVILKALSFDPKGRPASALAMAAELPARSGTASRRQPVRWIVGTAAALAVVAAATIWWFPARTSALTAEDTILIADFQNTTNEPVFDGTLKVALAVALEQSPFIKIFPDDRVRETLRLMSRGPDEPLTRTVAHEVARRELLKAFIAGSIGTIGKNYVLALQAVNVETGDVIARQQVEVAGKEQVLTSLGRAASQLREQLGESLSSIERFDVALTRATTPSLEALHAYSLAVNEWSVNPSLRATSHLKRALELDPNFALAYALLANVYAGTGQTARAPEYAERAYELRDRVSERERFFITFFYHRDALQAWDQALEVAKAWTRTYPRDAFAFNHLGMGFQRFGQYEQAIEAYRNGVKLDPKLALLYANLASALLAIDRYEDADRVFIEAATEGVESQGLRRVVYSLAFIRGDSETMTHALAASVGPGQTNSAYEWQSHAAAFSGHVNAAHEQFQLGARLASYAGFKEVAGQLAAQDAVAHSLVGQCEKTRTEVSAALAASRDNLTLELAARALALCGAERDASSLVKDLETRYPQATLTMRVSVPIAAAAIAVRSGQPERAIALLDPVRPYDHTSKAAYWPAYLRGLAYQQLKSASQAHLEFRSILDHRGEYPLSGIYPLAQLGAARTAAMRGDAAGARRGYERFMRMWHDADSGLQPMRAAREELARLK